MSAAETKFDPAKAEQLLREAEAWSALQARRREQKATADAKFAQARAELAATLAKLPDKVEIPYDQTPEGQRATKFAAILPERFRGPIDYGMVRKRVPFDRVLNWDGRFPAPAATGLSGYGKTFASWWALRRLYVVENKAFAWFPVRRLVTELERYEKAGCADEFFRSYNLFPILFVDDVDKINWDFESEAQMLFAFFDWVYRTQKPCIATTNRDRAWWKAKMGDAFVRRLFDEACMEVEFR